MDAEGFVAGYPTGCKMFAASHGWASEYHPSPSGMKAALLVASLDAQGADDEDVCFVDYLSLSQVGRENMPQVSTRHQLVLYL